MWTLSFNYYFCKYNILNMENYANTPEKKLSGVDLLIWPMYYHTWGFPVLVIEDLLRGVLEGILNCKQSSGEGL